MNENKFGSLAMDISLIRDTKNDRPNTSCGTPCGIPCFSTSDGAISTTNRYLSNIA